MIITSLGLLMATPVLARPLTARDILAVMATSRVGIQTLEAVYEGQITAPTALLARPKSSPAQPLLVREKISYRHPDLLRLNLSWPDREEVFLAAGPQTMVLVGDQAAETFWPQPPLLFRLLLEKDTSKLFGLLKTHGVNLNQVSNTHDPNSQPVVILGAQPDDHQSAQIHLSHQPRHLIRLILPPTANQPGYDVTMTDYRRHAPGLDWPGRLTISGRQDTTIKLTLTSLTINAQLERETFDVEEIKQSLTPLPDNVPAMHDPDMIQIRKQMKWLKKKLE